MADGPVEGVFKCRRCGTERVESHVEPDVLERLHRIPTEKILLEIMRRGAVKTKTLQRRFPDLPVRRILRELVQDGTVTLQQSGFAGHSLVHGKLAVLGKEAHAL
jgi:hypothetical protein